MSVGLGHDDMEMVSDDNGGVEAIVNRFACVCRYKEIAIVSDIGLEAFESESRNASGIDAAKGSGIGVVRVSGTSVVDRPLSGFASASMLYLDLDDHIGLSK